MQYIQLVLVIFILLHSSVLTINVYKSNQMSIFKSDKIITITNGIISFLPITSHILTCISYSRENDNEEISKILPFFIEWIIAIPLLLLNMTRYININPCIRFMLPLASTSMVVIGYASAINENFSISIALFVVSSILYVKILLFLYISYYYHNKQLKLLDASNNGLIYNNTALFRCLALLISITWNMYPISLILWKYGIIDMDKMLAIFISSDFITKGGYILLIMSYNMYVNGCDTRFVKIFKKIVKVYPISDIENRRRLENEIIPKSILKGGRSGQEIISADLA